MRRVLVTAAATSLLASILVAAPTGFAVAASRKIAPEVMAILDDLPPSQPITVIVSVREQARSIARPRGPGSDVWALRSTASEAQRDVRALLRAERVEGSVKGFTPLWVIDAISVTATADVVRALATREDVVAITSDEVAIVPSSVPESNIAKVRAPTVWGRGIEGAGVVVASLDSGVDVSHPDLAGSWLGGSDGWYDPYGQHPTTPTDMSGHGTATMGVIVGADAGGTSIGMAPRATWIAAKIFNDSGGATATAVHQAFQWVLDPDGDPNTHDAPEVVLGSWSIGTGPGCDLAFEPDLQALRTAGILPVFAAGNFGPGVSSSVSPANYPEAFAVGAVDNEGVPYVSSGQGPSTCGGRTGVFPDLVAPGVDVRTTDRYGLYQTVTGTSLSAPHVAGALALLLSAHPGLTPEEQAVALRAGATDLGPVGPDNTTGFGLLDITAALEELTLFADGFESGSFSAWSGVVTSSGMLRVNGRAALEGSYGMQATIVGTKGMFVTDRTPANEDLYRASFMFDPNGVVIPTGEGHDVFVGMHGSRPAMRVRIRSSSGGYRLRAIARNDAGGLRYSEWFTVTDAQHVLEILWSAAAGAGEMEIYADGVVGTRIGALNNASQTLETVRLGPQALGKGIRGSERFDAFVSTAGGTIG